jgi:hypothetical protein
LPTLLGHALSLTSTTAQGAVARAVGHDGTTPSEGRSLTSPYLVKHKGKQQAVAAQQRSQHRRLPLWRKR